jgi:hypothetical protein
MREIKGFDLHVTSEELSRLLKGRAEYHQRRAKDKEAELPNLRNLLERLKANPEDRMALTMIKSSAYNMREADPIGALEKDIRNHKTRAVKFDFYANHLAPGAVYMLSSNEAASLELVNDMDED